MAEGGKKAEEGWYLGEPFSFKEHYGHLLCNSLERFAELQRFFLMVGPRA
jgi:hypothetical protein